MGQRSTGLVDPHARSYLLRALSVLIFIAGICLVPSPSWSQTRACQMTLLGSVDAQQNPKPPVIHYTVGVDIRTFYLGRESEPANQPIILWVPPSNDLSALRFHSPIRYRHAAGDGERHTIKGAEGVVLGQLQLQRSRLDAR